ncbi:hypothetical protein E2F46_08785 [Luteimonas aestuarii]|uniref:Addiction module protein n=1 Tax=Luteimonas aestuarii TaxID=453837 RepID=A0A4R5TTN0_9GAMM|nr:hypothetical protein [Luteimonas aestuarii]TDK24368.1 hypothetical protein E2F46_08785 [Luteimonas aestuarii]
MATTRDDALIQLDQVDTALEQPEADKAALLRDAEAWLSAHPDLEPADALYYRERLQVIRERHGGD